MEKRSCPTLSQLESINPANGKVVWECPVSSHSEIDQAIHDSRRAFGSWSCLSFDERRHYVEQYAELLDKNKEDLAHTISLEMGKPLWESRGEIAAMKGKIPISIQAHLERCPEKSQELPAARSVLRHRPHGVVAVFGPFNFPGHLPNGHIVPALLAGNTVVLKPSEITPWIAHKMVLLWQEAGLPKGVLSLVQGGAEVGKHLAQHPGIDGLFFTGSSKTGLILAEAFAKQPEKILALEMGGNNPLIVWDVHDPQAAAYQVIQSAFLTSGQRCTCARRLILPNGKLGDEVIDSLTTLMGQIRVGPFDDQVEPFMGPLASAEAASRILQSKDALIKIGAKELVPMKLLKAGTGLLSPGLLDVSGVPDVPDEELFGPLLQIIRVGSLDEAITEANRTRYGLSAGILTDSKTYYERVLNEVRAGIINWNTQTTGASSAAPFGGTGISGNHRPSAFYAADYCCYPVASMEVDQLKRPTKPAPGMRL